jgi:hypothetical protein
LPNYWPFIAGIGQFLMGCGFIFHFSLFVVGVTVLIVAAYGWSFSKFE